MPNSNDHPALSAAMTDREQTTRPACPRCGRDRGNREPHRPGCDWVDEREQTTTRAFPNISVRPVREGRIGVRISGVEYVLTQLDASRLQAALDWALKEVSAA